MTRHLTVLSIIFLTAVLTASCVKVDTTEKNGAPRTSSSSVIKPKISEEKAIKLASKAAEEAGYDIDAMSFEVLGSGTGAYATMDSLLAQGHITEEEAQKAWPVLGFLTERGSRGGGVLILINKKNGDTVRMARGR